MFTTLWSVIAILITEMLFTLLIICIFLLTFKYLGGKYNEYYWKSRGVTFYGRNKWTGPFWKYLSGKSPLFLLMRKIYKKYPNEPAVGIGGFFTPTLFVKDPTNVQCVLTSDFNSFYHRGIEINEKDKLANNILFLNGKKWKLIRQNMTPLFTSSKLKSMYYIMDKSAQDFVQYIKEDPKIRKGDTFTTLSTFCSAAICATVFGVSSESIFNSPFLKVAQNSFVSNVKKDLHFILSHFSFTLFKLLNINFFQEFENFFISAIKQTVRQRERENVKKHDFADICVALQKNGNLKDPDNGFELEPTDELLAAQAFFFFVAGVVPTASAMFATLVELGKNPDIQERVHAEIDSVFEKHHGNLTYDIIAEMEYLEMVVNEAMRLHPSVGFVTRKCVANTVLPVGNIKVAKGTKIFIPIFDFHHDPNFFPDPEVFNPERFSRENKHQILDITYLPFGKGKRICVGMRYAHMQLKSGLVHMLRHFNVKTNIGEGGIKYRKHQIQVELSNVDVEFLTRE